MASSSGALHLGTGSAQAVLPAVIDIRQARALKAMLQGASEGADDCRIDASAVTRLSASGAQILLAFGRMMAVRGRSVTLASPSAGLKDSLTLLGLCGEFQLVFHGG